MSTDQSTIALSIYPEPRKLLSVTSKKLKSEDDLLQEEFHIVLLGEPGSGKTTTVKRLARKILLEAPKSKKDLFQIPLVIRLRELDENESLYVRIAKI